MRHKPTIRVDPPDVQEPIELAEVAEAFNEMTEALQRYEAWREDYVRTVSHDLRSPLNVIQPDRSSFEAIATAARRMNTMIQELVDSTRLETGQVELNRRLVHLPSLVSDLKKRLAGTPEAGRVQIEAPTDLPLVFADPDRLERIVMNLLSNALKYSPPSTNVTVTLRPGEGGVVCSVSDQALLPSAPADRP